MNPDTTYRNRAWMQARVEAGKTRREIADEAGVTVPCIGRWLFVLGLTKDTPESARRHPRACRTYANPEWWRKHGVEAKRSFTQLVQLLRRRGIGINIVTLKLWYCRFHNLGRLPKYPWGEPPPRGLTPAEKAKRQTRERAAVRLQRRLDFGKWILRNRWRRAVLRKLVKPSYREIIEAFYINEPLPATAVEYAREQGLSRAAVSAKLKRALTHFHHYCPIPNRFLSVTLRVQGNRRFGHYQLPQRVRAR